ncbi:Receptor-type tyrosine-protein phosphatase N2 [Saguinus oedipus]|uniref:Receptor-type tyrosine-protein phosphatase N2 n=1 Tax=Saguinus oedipus TaxID=9490 RepID=A0ABQ9UJ66_SAGOE|nr:Receptor-type tyrosine-protein phosphatase N2 [Saguinus oedipus]
MLPSLVNVPGTSSSCCCECLISSAHCCDRSDPEQQRAFSYSCVGGSRCRTCEAPGLSQDDDPFSESFLTYVAHTSALTYPPGPQAQLPEDLLPWTLSQLQPDELSPKVDSGVDRHHLMAALGAYAARRPPAPPGEGGPEPQYLLHAPPRMPRPLLAPATPQKWPSPLGDPNDSPSTGEAPPKGKCAMFFPHVGSAHCSPPEDAWQE